MSTFEKAWFVLSLTALAFGYGYACHAWGWFPQSHIESAWLEARSRFLESQIETRPRVHDRSGAHIHAPERMTSGVTLITSYWPSDQSDIPVPGARLIDKQGRILHEWLPDRTALFSETSLRKNPERGDYDGSYLFPNGDILLVLEYIGVVRLNSCGEVLWKLKKGNHHYFSRADDGSFWIPGTSSSRRSHTEAFPNGFPGIEKSVWIDKLYHVSPEGDVLDEINVLDLLYKNDLERHIVKGLTYDAEEAPSDVVHLNDVEPLSREMADDYPLFEAGDLVISLRHPSLVFVLDPDSETIKWHASHPFLHQHDPDFTGDGWIDVFDNNYDLTERGTMLGGSRIVGLQPHTDSMRIRFPTPRSDSFYTHVQGQWQDLGNGNMLLVERDAGRVLEVDSNGETIWEWIQEPYKDSQVPIVTGAHRYDLTREQVSSWACSAVDTASEHESTGSLK